MSGRESYLEISAALIRNYSDYAQGLDSKDWQLVCSCFADQVYIDYGAISAPSGDPAVPRTAENWLKVLQSVINGFDITRHTITNHRVNVSGSLVSCTACLIADHVIFAHAGVPLVGAQDIVTVVGEYTNHYEKSGRTWKINKSELVINWSSGNIALFEQAAKKVASGVEKTTELE